MNDECSHDEGSGLKRCGGLAPLIALVVCVAAALLLSACGGGDSTSSPASETTAAAETDAASEGTSSDEAGGSAASCGSGSGEKAAGKPINVGSIVTQSGGVDLSSAGAGTQAFFDCLNDNGGIGGRPVNLIIADDGNNPEKDAAAVAQLIGDDQVVAMVGNTGFIDCTVSGPTYEKEEIIDILATIASESCVTNPNILPVTAGPRLGTIGSAQLAKEDGKTTVALAVVDVPGLGDWVAEGLEGYAEQAGMDVVKTVKFAPGVKDATSIVLALKAANPEAIIPVSALPDVAAIMKAARQQGLDQSASWYCPTSCYDAALGDALEGGYEGMQLNIELQELTADTPDTALWREMMDKYQAGERQDTFAQAGFLSGMVFAAALEGALKQGVSADSLDRAAVTKAIKELKGFETDLTCGPLYYNPGGDGNNPNHATRAVKLEGDGSFAKVKGCYEIEDPALDPIKAAEQQKGLLEEG